MPKKTKHRKSQRRGELRGVATKGTKVSFGSFGVKALSNGNISSRQIESARRAMTGYMQRDGKVWIRIFPDKPITQKGAEVPMGKGKGAVDHYVAPVKAGKVLFEIDGVSEEVAREAIRLAIHKLSVRAKFVRKD